METWGTLQKRVENADVESLMQTVREGDVR